MFTPHRIPLVRPVAAPALLACAVLAAAACGGGSAGARSASAIRSADLTGAGATFPNPIYSKWFAEYGRRTGVRINYQSIGSGGGIRQFLEGTVDFGATDRPMKPEQIAQAKGNVLHIPTVLGADVLIYNLPQLAGRRVRLDGPLIADIFLGRVTRWNDPRVAELNPGLPLPDIDIIVIHRPDGSGTTFIFTDYLAKVSPVWKEQVGAATAVSWPTGLGGKGNEGVTAQVKLTEGAIGYVELVYALANKLTYAEVRNSHGNFVLPTLESVTAAAAAAEFGPASDFRVSITNAGGEQAYPIASFTWLLVAPAPRDAAKGAKLHEFLTWMLTPDAQAMARGLGYAPLPDALVRLLQQRVGDIRPPGAAST